MVIVINGTIRRAQVFGTETNVYVGEKGIRDSETSVQSGHAFGTELAVEDEVMAWTTFPTHAWNRLVGRDTKEVLLQLRHRINVDRSRDVATVIFMIKSTINNLVRHKFLLENSIQ